MRVKATRAESRRAKGQSFMASAQPFYVFYGPPGPDCPGKYISLVPIIDLIGDDRDLAWIDFSGVGTNESGQI
ncbi:MAG: hypothetical protein QGG34_17370 [SAR202 cluster bacterium]|nr:hypothetical protein [SAR202 cluster bacterium]